MKAVVLAAGEGVRMRPLTLNTPKPLLKVKGKTLLDHLLESLPREVNDIIIVEGYLGEQIRAHIGSSFNGTRVRYVHQPIKNGTFKALELCRPLLDDKRFLLVFADDFNSPLNWERCLEKKGLCVLLSRSPHPERFGVVKLNADGTLNSIVEKPKQPKSNLICCAYPVLDSRIFDFCPPAGPNNEYFIPDAVNLLAKKHPVQVAESDWWIPIGYPEDLKTAEAFLEKKG